MTLIAHFSGQNNILTIPRPFIHFCGGINAALFLSQLLYWTDRAKRADGFIYKSYKEWQEEIGLSENQVRRAVIKLEGEKIIEKKLTTKAKKVLIMAPGRRLRR